MNSVYPPTKYLTNGVWIYLVPQFKPKNVLILGYAGGTVAGLIRILYGWDIPITAVDIEPCKDLYGVNFIQTDARDFVKSCQKYDVVIVDLFNDNGYECDFVLGSEFVSDLQKICNYLIVNITNESDMKEYRKRFNKFGSNKPNRLSNKIYYFGTKDYNHLICR